MPGSGVCVDKVSNVNSASATPTIQTLSLQIDTNQAMLPACARSIAHAGRHAAGLRGRRTGAEAVSLRGYRISGPQIVSMLRQCKQDPAEEKDPLARRVSAEDSYLQ